MYAFADRVCTAIIQEKIGGQNCSHPHECTSYSGSSLGHLAGGRYVTISVPCSRLWLIECHRGVIGARLPLQSLTGQSRHSYVMLPCHSTYISP